MTSAISSSTGLVTGLPIQEIVNKLVSLDSGPMNQLQTQDTTLQAEQTAYTTLSADILSLEYTTNGFDTPSLYNAQTLTSSNASALTATSLGGSSTVTPGNYSYTPIQTAQAQQFISTGLSSDDADLGGGSVNIGFGGSIDNPVDLDLLNGGAGFTPGEIRITDRSGASAVINLTSAQNINDVLQDINSNTGINVTAKAVGDSIQLTDNTGDTTSNLQVSEVNGGKTAASLGLSGINSSSSTATGSSILSLFGGLPLSVLNNGTGVRFDNALSDLKINFADGSSSTVDFSSLPTLGTQATGNTVAANGNNAALNFTAVNSGPEYGGVTVSFQNNASITAGKETVNYDAATKQLTFNIAAGQTTASDIISALKNNSTVSALFTASTADGGNGSGIVSNSDVAYLTGPQATATTPGTLSSNAQLNFTAVNGGSAYDNVSVEFVDNASIQAGHETVAYDDSNPSNPTLVFQIAAGQTTAGDIVTALNNDPTASKFFTAANTNGSNGTGLVSSSDDVTTSGGALVAASSAGAESTLQDVLNTLNAAAPGKLQASIAPGGQSIQLTDLTTGSGTFSVSDLNNSQAAVDLGLTTAASGNTITGSPLLAGLDSSLLRNLNGGQGLGQLGTLDLTDRSGATAAVNLSGAQTVEDVINDINTAGIGIQAAVNSAGNGIQLTDTTGSTASNLIVADGDSNQTAEKLGLATNAATTSVNSGNLNLESVSENTTLASLNGGQGVAQGFFTITSSTGAQGRVNIGSNQTTIGDVLTEINTLGIGVQAQINSAGNGILLYDTAGGSGKLQVTEGQSTTAADLHLLGSESTTVVNGTSTQAINGSTIATITLNPGDTLQDLATEINAANVGATATVFSDGSLLNPYHLAISSNVTGLAGQLQIDTSQLGLTLNQTVAAQNALLSVNNTLVSSSSNTFSGILPGASLTVNSASSTPVTINAAADSTNLVATLTALVSSYNKVQSDLSQFTAFSVNTNSTGNTSQTSGPLYNDPTALTLETQLSSLVNQQFSGLGTFTSLAQLGITFNQDGSLSFDQSTFNSAYQQNPSAVQALLSTTTTGVGDQFKSVLQGLAGSGESVIADRNNAIGTELTNNQADITADQAMLNNEQQMLLTEFYNQETIVSQMQNTLSIVNSIQSFSELDGVSGSSSSSTSSGSSASTSSSSNDGDTSSS